jgi:hypothetical protein
MKFSTKGILVRNVLHAFNGDPFWVVQTTGLGMNPSDRFTSRGPFQHGASNEGFLLAERIVGMTVAIVANDDAEFWAYRNQLLSWFAPYNKIVLWLEMSQGAETQTVFLDCFMHSGMEFSSADNQGGIQLATFQLRALRPSFYAAQATAFTVALGGGGGSFTVPMTVPFTVGASSASVSVQHTYLGTWYGYPVIRFVGPMSDFSLASVQRDAKLDFGATAIVTGEWIEVVTAPETRTVKNQDGEDVFQLLTADSSLSTFYLAPDSDEVPDGLNSFTLTAENIDVTSHVNFAYRTRYIGR